MQIPETPQTAVELDLLKKLNDYAEGSATWDDSPLAEGMKQACRTLHTNLLNLVNGVFAFMLDRVTAREMEMFTMHDRVHGRKVAHLMWHILMPEKRDRLTPPEIGLLLVAAHLHDLGMGLTSAERALRLAPDSDLWDKLEMQETTRTAIDRLRTEIGDENTSPSIKRRSEQKLFQAEESLLTQDTRERHATRERYEEILHLLTEFHRNDPIKIPDIDFALSFDGDSFRDKLIDVCMSHNEDADALVSNDPKNLDRPRFPKDYPVGRCTADLHLVSAALRLADILDFDRERTPAVLFHYLLPTVANLESRSVLEWSKHLAISNWHIERDAIVFRGRSNSHIIHHTVVQFCAIIVGELRATHATFSPFGEENWPFAIPLEVTADIHEDGYRYVPYKFELDDERVYSLLMGGAIYDNPLVAVRELVQNAVDACKLRDSLTRLYEDYEEPSHINRIFIRYEEPSAACTLPRLIVRDTGTGMDAYTLERYFLKVGRSYYDSSDFNHFRVQLRKKDLDFAPVSEFGIGFLSTFLLADHVEVETAMWEPLRGDTTKRTLRIDGPTRLIRLDEERNDGAGRFKGTRITLFLVPKVFDEDELIHASWQKIKEYLADVCLDLPYHLHLEYKSDKGLESETITPVSLQVELPSQMLSNVVRIPVDDQDFGLEGEIVLASLRHVAAVTIQGVEPPNLETELEPPQWPASFLLRGGFKADRLSMPSYGIARLRLTWNSRRDKRFLPPNLARNEMSNSKRIDYRVFRLWLSHLLSNVDSLPEGLTSGMEVRYEFDPWLEEFDGFTVYELARLDWKDQLRMRGIDEAALKTWEKGEGSGLWFSFQGLSRDLMNLILPRVARLQIGPNGDQYVSCPSPNWKQILEECHDFVTSESSWGRFVDYDSSLRDFLFFQRGLLGRGFLNARYEAGLKEWSDEELLELIRALNFVSFDWLNLFDQAMPLDAKALSILRRVVATVGDVKTGSPTRTVSLNTLISN